MSTFPFPIPHGWFGLCFSHELAHGEVKKVRFCGNYLAVFRTESGIPAALDNYCPHLGASLSQGCVIGETLRCPFHHWQWGAQGECVEIPYANSIPSRAVANALPVKEVNGMIMGWFHPDGIEPYFDIDEIPMLNEARASWGEPEFMDFNIGTCLQEIAENDVDQAHFLYVHGSPSFKETETTTEGPIKTSLSEMDLNAEYFQGEVDESNSEAFKTFRRTFGPGVAFVHGTGVRGMQGQIGEFMLYSVSTPVEDDRTILRWTMVLTKNLVGDDMGKTMLHSFATGIDDDIPIWEDKVYRENPVLCDGDGPINKHRKWFSQFYS